MSYKFTEKVSDVLWQDLDSNLFVHCLDFYVLSLLHKFITDHLIPLFAVLGFAWLCLVMF